MRNREDLDSVPQDAVDHDVRVSAKNHAPGLAVESRPPFRGFADGCHLLHKPFCRSHATRRILSCRVLAFLQGVWMELEVRLRHRPI